MGSFLSRMALLSQVALRNLVAHRLKTIIVGGIILFGALLVVVGGSLLDAVDNGMQRSIQGSVAGHIQIYSTSSKDPLAIWGTMMNDPDVGQIDDFAKVRSAIETLPDVKTVVPMGISGALVTSGNTVDLTLEELRKDIDKQRSGDTSSALADQIAATKDHVRQIVNILHDAMKNVRELADVKAIDPANADAVERARSEAFWADFDKDPLNSLEYLENKIAPQVVDADVLPLRYIGTDLDAFQKSFDRMEIVDGTAVPEGHRGFLFAKFFYEDQLKMKTARRLDRIKEAIEQEGKKISEDEQLQLWVKQNMAQVQEVQLQFDRIKTQKAIALLQKDLDAKDTDLGALLSKLFNTNDQNFIARYNLFYEHVAPLLELYRIRVGDILTIKAFTKTGYTQSVNVKVYGTFNFKGLEKSALAGNLNLMDLMSFRDLYGFLTTEKSVEIAKLKQTAGAVDIERGKAEDELFGTARNVVAEATPGLATDELDKLKGTARALRTEDLVQRVYSSKDIGDGVALNGAVVLKNASHIRQVIGEIKALSDKENLGITAVSWQEAAGLIGQMVYVMKAVLYVAVLIIFLVALVIINNSMMMATLERVREIGTMRAIGAQRAFVRQMLLIEAVVIGVLFGGLGVLLGSAAVKGIAARGIPAFTDVAYFFFSGPRLRPALGGWNLVGALVIVLLVSALSSFYPAWLGSRVAPVTAMQTDE
jgi:ABC-type lipoprotein release transport system permease subunit